MIAPRFVERDTITIAGASTAGQPGEFNYAEIWEKKYGPLDALLKPLSLDGGTYGATFREGDHLVYIAGVSVADSSKFPKGMDKREIPAAAYAVVECTLSTMDAIMQEVYGEWFHSSDKELDVDAIGFEYYLPYSGDGEIHVEMYVPIKPKTYNLNTSEENPMNVYEAISNRRSIRKFKNDPIPEEDLHKILQAGILAPSGKNRQPWKFLVVQGEKRAEMITQMLAGIDHNEKAGRDCGSSRNTVKVMAQAPVTVFIFNPVGIHPWQKHSIDQMLMSVVDTQSIGAAIQNMLLAAQELGIGSLWICDVFSAYEELSSWLGESSEMIAAISFGYANEHPIARKRRSFDDVVRWI
jgi:nitroreductase/predicted transcriptional regulator YdeE